MNSPSDSRRAAFARADLLAVIVVLSVGGLLALPLLAQPLRHSRTAQCLENLRELMAGTFRHAADNDDRLPPNEGGETSWAGGGWLQLPATATDTDPAAKLQAGALWPYMQGKSAAYRCPEDFTGRDGPDSAFLPRVRSFAMSSFMGTTQGWPVPGNAPWKRFAKLGDLARPAGLWVYIEERPDSINDGYFAVDMSGFPDRPEVFKMVDFPSFYHGRGGTLAYGDGHAELRVWQDDRTIPLYTGSLIPLDVRQPHNPDLAWLFERSSVRK